MPKTVVLGIAGGSASGKTTFSNILREYLSKQHPKLKVEHIGMDRFFYRGENGGPSVTLSDGKVFPNNNHPDSADNAALVRAVTELTASVEAPNILIIEGLMTFHVTEVRALLDLKLFVDLDADLRALRRLLRDMAGGRGNADAKFIADYYRECARVGHAQYVEPSKVHADLTLRGDADFNHSAHLLTVVLLSLLNTN